MKKTFLLLSLSFLIMGCSPQTTQSTIPEQKEKAPNSTLTGKITKTGDKFYISDTGKPPVEISTYTLKLDEYVGKTVAVTGQYSGTTLFVDSVK